MVAVYDFFNSNGCAVEFVRKVGTLRENDEQNCTLSAKKVAEGILPNPETIGLIRSSIALILMHAQCSARDCL